MDLTEVSEGNYVASGTNPAASLTFNDKGKGFIIGSFRVVMPNDDANMKKIQQDFGSEKALIANLIKPTLYKVVTSCGPLMSSLESETRTDLIAYITDQLNNGVYKTVVIRDSVTNEITGEKEMRAKAQIVADTNSPSGYKRQETSPFSQYGITCGLVSILDIKYDGATQSQIDAQKQANLAVITSKTKSLEAIQRTVQITEEGRAAAERAKWEQEKEKAIAVTKAQQEFEVAELEAKKAKQVALKVQAEARDKVSFNNPTGSVCPVCGKRFPKSKGKIYCSKECREKDKNYPSKQEVLEQYELLKTWDKVAEYFGLTRRIIQRIRNQ